MDLIREVLILVEGQADMDGTAEFALQAGDPPLHECSQAELDYHVRLLCEAALLRGNKGGMLTISRLTWEGHEFLESVKDPGIWKKVQEKLSGLQGAALSVVAQLAQAEVKKHFNLP